MQTDYRMVNLAPCAAERLSQRNSVSKDRLPPSNPCTGTSCNESLTQRDRGLIFVSLPARDKLRSLALRMGVIDPFAIREGGHSGKFCRLDCDTKAVFPGRASARIRTLDTQEM